MINIKEWRQLQNDITTDSLWISSTSTNNRPLFIKNITLSLVMPVLAHTAYDFCLYTENLSFVGIFILFIIFIYVYSIKKIKRVSKNNKSLIKKEITLPPDVKYCPFCGTLSSGEYCHKCGTKLQ